VKKDGSIALLVGRLFVGIFHCIAPAVVALAVWAQLEIFAETYGVGLSFTWSRILAMVLLFLGLAIAVGVWVRLFSLVTAILTAISLVTVYSFWSLSGFQHYVVRLLFQHQLVVLGSVLIYAAIGGGRHALVHHEMRSLTRPLFGDWANLLSRLFMGGGFLWMAICGVVEWDVHILFLKGSSIPFPDFVHTIAFMMQFLGGLLILVGFRHRFAAILMMVYVVAVLLFVHQPFDLSLFDAVAAKKGIDIETFIVEVYPSDRLLRTQFLFSHLAILGGLLALWVAPFGRFSLEGSLPPARRH